ncbi:MAG: TIGR03619 family F420-dependent LLM class oxidoreductase [Candidatus Rokuibacteriota bacterium]
MKVGVNLINFGPGAGPESLARSAALAEALGYHFVMASDHVAITPDVAGRYPAPFYEPFTLLGWLAAATRAVELGTTVIVLPYRHPLEVARMAANVDRLSGGRLILGVGAGWARQEFEALGVDFERRGAITNEYLAAIKTAWTTDVASYRGRFVAFENVHTAPPPARRPHPPIWVGGASDAALRRAVRFGDAWHPIRMKIGWLRDTGLPRLREIAEKEGRAVPALCPRIRIRLTDTRLDDAQRVASEGTLDQVRADLETLQALGAEHVLLDTYADDPDDTRNPEPAWRMLTVLAEKAFDLGRQTLRS